MTSRKYTDERVENGTDARTRRGFLRAAISSAPAILLAGCAHGEPAHNRKPDQAGHDDAAGEIAVSANEDLMREHGLLQRCLLIYHEGARRLTQPDGPAASAEVIQQTAQILRQFVEQYHERLEERFVFPRLEKAGVHVELVRTLRTQHDRGRHVTGIILERATDRGVSTTDTREVLAAAMQSYERMYRPHEAREDTVIFPALKSVLAPEEYDELGERFEEIEHQRFGEDGFDRFIERVAAIERRMGIHDLSTFTPQPANLTK